MPLSETHDVVDTDPLVTEAVIRRTVVADSLPIIPSLAGQILLATESMARRAAEEAAPSEHALRERLRTFPGGVVPDGSIAALVLDYLLKTIKPGDQGLRAVEILRWLKAERPDEKITASMVSKTMLALENCGRVTSHGEYRSHRFRAVAK